MVDTRPTNSMNVPWKEIVDRPIGNPHRWRWRCPHCLGGNMKLESAVRHLRRRHNDCWSCRLERTMVEAMRQGTGFYFETKLV